LPAVLMPLLLLASLLLALQALVNLIEDLRRP
jgi:hypothetical protein